MCLETKLPLFTSDEIRYKSLAEMLKVKIIDSNIIKNNSSPEIIFEKAKIL